MDYFLILVLGYMKSKSLLVTILIGIVKDTLHGIYSSAYGMISDIIVTIFDIDVRHRIPSKLDSIAATVPILVSVYY